MRRPLSRGFPAGVGIITAFLSVILLLTPLIALGLPASLRDHTYDEVSFRYIARTQLPPTRSPEAIVEASMNYTRRQLWLIHYPDPYSAKPFRYLVDGVGWCDYVTKVFCKLVVNRGIPARYTCLMDATGISPHTIAEIYTEGNWRPVDPFHLMIYRDKHGVWPTLEELTPAFVERLPRFTALRGTTSGWDESILAVARRTLPTRHAPDRSDDFLREKHLLDRIADLYVDLFGRPFAEWYQDRYLERELAPLPDPAERLWLSARHYHLYGRLERAEKRYRQLLALGQTPHREPAALFLCQLLIDEKRFSETRSLLNGFAQEMPQARWPYFPLSVCERELGDTEQELRDIQIYRRRNGQHYGLEAAERFRQLSPTKNSLL